VTDGKFHDDEVKLNAVGNLIKEREREGKLHFYGLGVEGYVRAQLENFTINPTHVLDIKAKNLNDFFKWVGRSLAAISKKEINEPVVLAPYTGPLLPDSAKDKK
jgi:uncharacterized protein YegL